MEVLIEKGNPIMIYIQFLLYPSQEFFYRVKLLEWNLRKKLNLAKLNKIRLWRSFLPKFSSINQYQIKVF